MENVGRASSGAEQRSMCQDMELKIVFTQLENVTLTTLYQKKLNENLKINLLGKKNIISLKLRNKKINIYLK